MENWAGRAQRAHSNMLEVWSCFAILVLVAKAAGISNAMNRAGRAAVLLGPRGTRRALHRRRAVGAHGGVGRVGGGVGADLLQLVW